MNKIKILIAFGLIVSLAAGCLPDEESLIPNRIDFRFNVENVGTEIKRGQDSIEVREVKFLLDKFILDTDTDARLPSDGVDALVLRYVPSDGQDEEIIATPIQYDFENFTGVELLVDKANQDDAIDDDDFKDGDETYAFIFKGKYNGNDFVYRSKVQFSKLFEFPSTVTLTADKETLVLRILTNVEEWIVDPDTDQVIDPTDTQNISKIDSLLEVSLGVDAYADTSVDFI